MAMQPLAFGRVVNGWLVVAIVWVVLSVPLGIVLGKAIRKGSGDV